MNQAEIIYEKGTNRSAFLRSETAFYEWKSIGSSYALSEINAAVLRAQLMQKEQVTAARLKVWNEYKLAFSKISVPFVPEYAKHNAHIYYLQLADYKESVEFIQYMQKKRFKRFVIIDLFIAVIFLSISMMIVH